MRTRLEALQAKLQARTGKPGLEKNCEAIRREIASLSHRQEIEKLTTSQNNAEASAVASEANKDQSGDDK